MNEELDNTTSQSSGPRLVHSLTEMPRSMLEMSFLGMSWLPLLAEAPKGEAHPVMVLPGFIGGDESTLMLRRFLTRLGYKALPWLQGTNTGNPQLLEGAMRRLFRMHQALGTKISLIGQSLGGVFAREIANEFPDAVRCVVTLGSPYAAIDQGTTNAMVERMFEELSGLTIEQMKARIPQGRRQRLPLPATSIYSKEDGVVAWQACIEPESELSENIRVLGSHSGMAMHPSVLRVVADRLAQDPNDWQKFDVPNGCSRFLYPDS